LNVRSRRVPDLQLCPKVLIPPKAGEETRGIQGVLFCRQVYLSPWGHYAKVT